MPHPDRAAAECSMPVRLNFGQNSSARRTSASGPPGDGSIPRWYRQADVGISVLRLLKTLPETLARQVLFHGCRDTIIGPADVLPG